MLYFPIGATRPLRIQGAFITEKEINNIMRSIRRKEVPKAAQELWDNVKQDLTKKETGQKSEKKDDDEEIEDDNDIIYEVIDLFVKENRASISLIRRRFRMGDSRAGRIIDEIEDMGIISRQQGNQAREVLITPTQWEEMKKDFKKQDDE